MQSPELDGSSIEINERPVKLFSDENRRYVMKRLTPYLFVLPAILFMAAFFVYPLATSLRISFRSMRLWEFQTGGSYLGLENYNEAFSDPMVQNSLIVTTGFMIVSVSLEMILGVLIAHLLNADFRGRRAVRAAAIIPIMLTPVVVGLNFRLMFNRRNGVFNWLLGLVGIEPISWLADPFFARVSVVITEVWNQTPFVALIALAGLQAIPSEIIDSAKVDGASRWRIFWNINLPLISPMLLVAAFWRSIATFRIFDIVTVMTSGGPVDETETMSLLVSKLGFNWGRMGYATAVSYILIVCMIIMAVVYNRLLQRVGE